MALVQCGECGKDVSKKADKCPHCGAPAKKKTSAFTWVMAALLGLVFVGYLSEPGTGGAMATAQPDPRAVAMKAVSLDYSWQKGGFDSVMLADLKVTNAGARSVKDIEVECVHFAKSGTRIDANKRTIFDVVPAGETKNFKEFNMGMMHGQADTTACRVVGLSV